MYDMPPPTRIVIAIFYISTFLIYASTAKGNAHSANRLAACISISISGPIGRMNVIASESRHMNIH